MQTTDHHGALIAASPNRPAVELEERMKAGLEMQKAVLRRVLQSTFYIHELALQLPVGGPEVHAEQVHHLLRMAVRSNITMRIVPTARGAHAGTRGPFTYLAFAKYEPLVCLESENSTLFVEETTAVKGYETVVHSRDEAALGAEESKELLISLGEELATGASPQICRSEIRMPDPCTVGAPFVRW